MRITFPHITYQNKLLLWNYDKQTDKASLLFTCFGDSSEQDTKAVLNELRHKQYEGVLLAHDSATIDNVSQSGKQYMMDPESNVVHYHYPARSSDSDFAPEESQASVINTGSSSQVCLRFNIPLLPLDRILTINTVTNVQVSPSVSPSEISKNKSAQVSFSTASNSDAHQGPGSVPATLKLEKEAFPSPRSDRASKSPRIKRPAPVRSNSLFNVFPELRLEVPESREEVKTVAQSASSSSSSSPKVEYYMQIKLDSLIPAPNEPGSVPGVWSDTLACESCFQDKTKEDSLGRRAFCLLSKTSLFVMHQYERNNSIYELKSMMIKNVRSVMINLNVLFLDWINEQHPSAKNIKSVYLYFRKAVHELMQFNAEVKSKSSPFVWFKQANGDNQKNTGLLRFSVLIFPEMKLDKLKQKKLISNMDEVNALAWFKNKLQNDKNYLLTQECLKEQLGHWVKSIKKGCDVLVRLKHEINGIDNQCKENVEIIAGYYSFFYLASNCLRESFKNLTSVEVGVLVRTAIKEIIMKMNGHPEIGSEKRLKYMASLSTMVDNDFYLCKEWALALRSELEQMITDLPATTSIKYLMDSEGVLDANTLRLQLVETVVAKVDELLSREVIISDRIGTASSVDANNSPASSSTSCSFAPKM